MPDTINEFGEIKISPDVISTYVANTVMEIEGVYDLGSNFQAAISKNILGKETTNRGIKITETKDDGITIDIFIIVEFGTKIPEIAWNIQKKITETLNNTVQLPINEININVQGVHLEKHE